MSHTDNDLVFGGSGDDKVIGGSGTDSILGQSGNDHLVGGNGGDTLLGGSGNDLVDGGGGSDSLRGGTGSDAIIGGAGTDTLSGDGGSDLVAATTELDSELTAAWLAGGSYTQRVQTARSLMSADVASDDHADVFASDGGRDWFLVDPVNDTFSVARNELFEEI